MWRLMAPFGITIRRKKVAYCNNNVIPRLKRLKIRWDMDEKRIIFCNKTFPMKYIDDGKCEEFIDNLVDENGQSKLIIWEK